MTKLASQPISVGLWNQFESKTRIIHQGFFFDNQSKNTINMLTVNVNSCLKYYFMPEEDGDGPVYIDDSESDTTPSENGTIIYNPDAENNPEWQQGEEEEEEENETESSSDNDYTDASEDISDIFDDFGA